jgi:hypothetical protein
MGLAETNGSRASNMVAKRTTVSEKPKYLSVQRGLQAKWPYVLSYDVVDRTPWPESKVTLCQVLALVTIELYEEIQGVCTPHESTYKTQPTVSNERSNPH